MIPSLEPGTIGTHDLLGRTLFWGRCGEFPTKRHAGNIGESAPEVKAGTAGISRGTGRRWACISGSGCEGSACWKSGDLEKLAKWIRPLPAQFTDLHLFSMSTEGESARKTRSRPLGEWPA